MALPRIIWRGRYGSGNGCLSKALACAEAGLSECARGTFVSIPDLLSRALPFDDMHVHVVGFPRQRQARGGDQQNQQQIYHCRRWPGKFEFETVFSHIAFHSALSDSEL